ncbi:hypothetical protein CEXT_69311 [Caerostris extrusa]|uniref:Uncharacterized protein n=1 Tax=Caerostris extrusa TaxID=172846 RepID=A0AAV4P8B0_CAEEX|nr:hypothetical protein CEXT_69311 [Caerostris extrusa]
MRTMEKNSVTVDKTYIVACLVKRRKKSLIAIDTLIFPSSESQICDLFLCRKTPEFGVCGAGLMPLSQTPFSRSLPFRISQRNLDHRSMPSKDRERNEKKKKNFRVL